MPIPYMSPLDNLRSLAGSGFTPSPLRRRVPGMGENIPASLAGDTEFQTPDPSSQLLALQQQRQSEQEDPRFADRPDLKGLRGSLQSDIAENPLTQQSADVAGQLKRQQASVNQGYGGPNPVAEQAAAAQKLEQQKVSSPVDVEKIKGLLGLQTEQERTRGVIEAAKTREQGYSARTAAQSAKDAADNATKLQIAMVNSGNRVGAAALSKVIPELARINEGIARGMLDPADPKVIATLKQFTDLQNRYAPQGAPAPTTPDAHVKDIMMKHPGQSLQGYLSIADDPAGEYGGFERPEDRVKFQQALTAAGVR